MSEREFVSPGKASELTGKTVGRLLLAAILGEIGHRITPDRRVVVSLPDCKNLPKSPQALAARA